MLTTSLRRAAWAMPVPGLTRSSGQALAVRGIHHRRYSSSSSKPPVPPSDGSRRMDTSSTPAKGVSSSNEKGKAARRRGKDNSARNGSSKASQQNSVFANLPSVPSTQHLQPHGKHFPLSLLQLRDRTDLHQDVHVASFFSIHRPMSVTSTVPPASSAEAFDAIFSSKRTLKNEPEDVIFTLSSTVQSMENTAHSLSEPEDQLGQLNRSFASEQDGELRMMDGPEAKMSVEEFTRRLRPFNPPPPPTSTYSTVLTIRESRHADGRKTYEAHTGPFVFNDDVEGPAGTRDEVAASIDAPSGFGSGTTYIERLRYNRSMHTLSTKRRRRVKMKKHKFKKLMRRTRTLRRKLDKA
ncbi:hypothetical protein N7474_009690 [Penicillium riverlandense]|uniref:uncharacterized protein n=1 Tax=Penicillium riverlandense TaxID=1903569 RepID=UPI0025486DDB|nr:uncharacterized protein N7474_009690 [Penicillium riverlandense]KAJ5808421.1 hypothetical protein N7474_009690 [Penicillium riverlandense]